MIFSIIIPVYNEHQTLLEIIDKVRKSNLPKELTSKQIIIIDDFSTDGTREILKNLDISENVQVAFHEVNQGKGATIQTGIKYVKGDIVLIQDADLEYDPNEYENLTLPIIEDKADVVYGSRFFSGRPHRVLYFWHSVANNILTLLSNMFSDLNLTDMETCYKVFKADIIKRIENSREKIWI